MGSSSPRLAGFYLCSLLATAQEPSEAVDLLITQRGNSGGDAAHGRLDILKCRLAAGGAFESLEVSSLDLDAPTVLLARRCPSEMYLRRAE